MKRKQENFSYLRGKVAILKNVQYDRQKFTYLTTYKKLNEVAKRLEKMAKNRATHK